MKEVAYLFALSAEARVFQRPPKVMIGHPKSENALIYFAELAALPALHSVDDGAQPVSIDVFLSD